VPFGTGSDRRFIYEYNLKDHLGDSRIIFMGTDLGGAVDIVQATSYYPFGLIMNQTNGNTAPEYQRNEYLYNGKELQSDNFASSSLNWYDYGARFYDPQIGRFTTQDPFAAKYYSLSPFSYVANNPLKFIDPDGKEIVIVTKRNKEGSIVETLKYSEGKLYMNNGKEYSGSNSFALKVQNTLNNLIGTDNKEVQGTISLLEGSKNKHYIEYNPSGANDVVPTAIDLNGVNKGDPSGSHVRVSLIEGEIENGLPSTKETIMAHELKHADDYDKGNMVGRIGVEPSNTSPFEIRAVNFENKVRSANKMELRKTYGGKPIDKKKLEDPTK
jgi:RHS repeat-associated protein